MTVSNQQTEFPYVGNGVTVTFAYTCQVQKPGDLQVYVNGAAVTSGITKNGIGSLSGGSVTFSVAPASGAAVRLERVVVLERTTDYQQNGDFLARVVNPDFDRIWMALQQFGSTLLRSLRFPKSDINPITELPPASVRANKILSFDENGNPATISPASGSATALALLLFSSIGSSLIGFIQYLTGAVWRTLQDKVRERISVKDFGAKGDGITNDLPALMIAAAAMTDNMELEFPAGVYLLQWTGAKPEKSIIALDLFKLKNIKITGQKAIIKIVDHNVGTYGGLLFLRPRACKNIEVSGFHSDMSFVGSNNSALNYPESGFMYGHNTNENSPGGPVADADQLANVEVHHCTFNIRSQYGAYTTSQNPYNGDDNNGGKYYSVFIRGEQADSAYSTQNKGCNIHDLTFYDTHHAYGIWVWGFSDTMIHHNNFLGYAVRTGNYLNVTLGGSVPAIRCHKFFTRNWRISDNIIQGRVSPARTGALDGASAFISFQQEATAYDAESTVTICDNTLVIGSNNVNLTDLGIQLLCGGNFDIHSNTFSCSSALLAAVGIQVGDNSSYATNISQYVNIHENTFAQSFNKGQPIIYTSASTIAANQRTLKSFIVQGNIFNGYYRSVIAKNNLGATFEGAIFQMIHGNAINGGDNTACPPSDTTNIPFDIYVEQPADAAMVSDNLFRGCYIGIRVTGPSIANCYATNNKVIGAVLKPIVGVNNFRLGGGNVVYTYPSASSVVVTGDSAILFNCSAIAVDGTGLVKNRLAGAFPGGTVLVAAPTGLTWYLTQNDSGDAA